MIFLGGARQIGKTTKAIEWLKGDKHRTLLVHSRHYAEDLKRHNPEVAPQIFEFENYKSVKKGFWPQSREIAIDNIDIIISRWFNVPVKFVTFTGSVDFTDAYCNTTKCKYDEADDHRFG